MDMRDVKLFFDAVKYGETEKVIELLDKYKGEDIHVNKDSALIIAAQYGRIEILKELLGRGADIHAQEDWALRMAAENGRLNTVKELLDRGADIHAKEDLALKLAVINGHEDVVELLQQHMEKEKQQDKKKGE